MDKTSQDVAAAQEMLHKAVTRSLKKYGIEATLTALAEQFGITGATDIIRCGAPASHFSGVYVLRALGVCNQLCDEHYVKGVL